MYYGLPQAIQSDNGAHFTGHKIREWAKEHGVHWIYHIPYHPQAANLVERMNSFLKEQIHKLTPTQLRGQNRALGKAAFLLNNRVIPDHITYQRITGLHTDTGGKALP